MRLVLKIRQYSMFRFLSISFLSLSFIICCITLAVGCQKDRPTQNSQTRLSSNDDSTFVNFNQGKFFQRIEFEIFDTENGLSSSSITRLFQDKEGFLWVGTDNGLNRYDGRTFRVWQNDLSDSTSFPGGDIVDLAEDSEQNIWMLLAGKGLCRFDIATETFRLYNDSTYQLHDIDHDSRFFLDKKDRIWFQEGYFDARTCKYQPVKIGGEKKYSYQQDANGNVFAIDVSKRLLFQLEESANGLGKFKLVSDSLPTFADHLVKSFTIDKKGNFLIAVKDGGFYRFHPFQKTPVEHYIRPNRAPFDSVQYHLGGSIMDCFWSEKTQIVWLSQWEGLVRLDTRPDANPKVYRYLPGFNPRDLPDKVTTAVIEDRSGVLWVGTAHGGLAKFAPAKQRFSIFRKIDGDTTSLSDKTVTAIFQDSKERIWVGTKKYLNQIDLSKGVVKSFPILKGIDAYGSNPEWITSISEDISSGKLLITYWGAGFNWFDPETQKFSKPKVEHSPQGDFWLYLQKAIFFSPDSILLFEWGNPMLYLYLKKTGRLMGLKAVIKDGDTIRVGLAHSALLDKQRNIWIGFDQEKGLLCTRFSGSDTLFFHYKLTGKEEPSICSQSSTSQLFLPNPANKQSLASGTITTIFEDSKGRLWIGTRNGLHLLKNQKLGIFRRFGKDEGFPDAGITSILEDDKGHLWITTNAGLSIFDPNEGIVEKNFNYTDGLPGNQFNPSAAFKGKNGQMFFGSLKGLVSFHPDSLGKNLFTPPVGIVRVVADQKEIRFSIKDKKIILPKGTTNLRVEFAALDFNQPEANLFQYKLVGYEDEFSPPSKNNSAYYTKIPPDKEFELVVKGGNNDGGGFIQEKKLTIFVSPHWYESRLFCWTAFLSALVVFYFIIKHTLRKINADRDRSLLLKTLQVQTHQAQMNPHFIFNVLTAIKSLVINRQPEEAGKYLDKFAVLIRRYLDASVKSGISKQQSVVENEISLAQEIELIDMYVEFEQLKYEGRFEYERPQPDFVVENISIPPMLIQPFVENAIKHGILNLPNDRSGHLKVSFVLEPDDTLVCTVEDNGIGMAEAKRLQEKSIKHFQSLGTSLTEERRNILNQLGYKITIDTCDRTGGGTIVTIRVT